MSVPAGALEASFYPSGVVNRLLHSIPTPFQTTLLLTSLYSIEIGKTLIGTIGQKILYILWKVLIGNRPTATDEAVDRNDSGRRSQSHADSQRRSGRSSKGMSLEKEMDYDEVYEEIIEKEEFIPLSSTSSSANDNGIESASAEAVSEPVNVNHRPTITKKIKSRIPLVSTFKTRDEDRKSKKGNMLDIEKLRRTGYNRYRFVSQSFIKRNNLSTDPSEYERDD